MQKWQAKQLLIFRVVLSYADETFEDLHFAPHDFY